MTQSFSRSGLMTAASLLAVFVFWVLKVQSQSDLLVGYATIQTQGNSSLPVSTALFSFRNAEGILVAEAGVGAVEPIRRGRIFVDASIPTGLALANPSSTSVTTTLTLRDAQGSKVAQRQFVIPAGEHRARFVSEPELFGTLPEGFIGSATFATDVEGLASLTVRQARNTHGEPLLATLPVSDLDRVSAQPSSAVARQRSFQQGITPSLIFPHLGAGGILTTQLILINPTGETHTGEIRITGSDGLPLELELDGHLASSFPYELGPDGVFEGTLTSSAGVLAGYAVVTVEQGTLPSGTAIFQFRDASGSLTSEAGVGAVLPTTRARIFVDTVNTRTGVAISSPGSVPTTVTFRLLDRNGLDFAETTRDLPANGHLAIFADELFENLPPGFTGVLDIDADEPIVPITLKLTVNERGDFVLTTLPVADLSRPIQTESLVFPQIGFGMGFSTRLILISAEEARASTGLLTLTQSDGSPLNIPLLGVTASQFNYEVFASGIRQLRPGNIAQAGLLILDSANPNLSGIVVNEGNRKALRPVVIDTAGDLRDDFPIGYLSLDEQVATVAETGEITGITAGFSTLTIQAGGLIRTASITVVRVSPGAAGFSIVGIAEDLSGRLFLASPSSQQIFLARTLTETPEVYAGVGQSPGLVDDVKLKALFNGPRSIALNQADGSLYVADRTNHVIRRIPLTESAFVQTVAGNGQPGSLDGVGSEARFNNPSGVALDARGGLWVADTGNHTVRRLDLITGMVETIAGLAGQRGADDGLGANARFNTPTGIAVQSETLGELLQRELNGEPPPPVRVVVADRGNNRVRSVTEEGVVLTLTVRREQGIQTQTSNGGDFDDPQGVAADPFGNVYVSESTGRVTIVTATGKVVEAVQEGTFEEPADISITQSGRLVIADSTLLAREIQYGPPRIDSVTPAKVSSQGGEQLSLTGANFAPEAVVLLGGTFIKELTATSSEILISQTPPLPSGRITVTVLTRGGLAQSGLLVETIPLEQLPAGYVTTVAGGSTFAGDGLMAQRAEIGFPAGIDLDSAGNLYFADPGNHRIRRVDAATGIITSVAGIGTADFSGDGGLAIGAGLNFPRAIAVDQGGNLLILDTANQRVRRVDADTGIITTVAGSGERGFSPDHIAATQARLNDPDGIAVDPADNLFIADTGGHRVLRVDSKTGTIETVAGSFGTSGFNGDGIPAIQATLNLPFGVQVDSAGNILIADTGNHRIRHVDTESGVIETLAGTGVQGFSGDDGPAGGASLSAPVRVKTDSQRNILIADTLNQRIRKIHAETGTISTVAGNGMEGFLGDGGPALNAAFSQPQGLVADSSGDLYISDHFNKRIRRVSATGLLTSVVGGGDSGFPGDGGPASTAAVDFPRGVATHGDSLYIADTANTRIRRVDLLTNLISTVAGNGEFGYSGDNGPSTEAMLDRPDAVIVDSSGDLIISDTFNHRIRIVDSPSGMIRTIGGNGAQGFSGDGGPALAAAFNFPLGLAVDLEGNIFVVDSGNHRIRRINRENGIITTVAGSGAGFSGDGGPATAALLFRPSGVALDCEGNLYIADTGNDRIRRVEAASGIITTVAGTSDFGFSGDHGPATEARLNLPGDVTLDSEGNLLFSDSGNHRIRRVDWPSGIITTVAGTGGTGFSVDGLPAGESSFFFPAGIAFDADGNLYVADTLNDRVRGISGPIG